MVFEPAGGISKPELAARALADKPTEAVIPYDELPYGGKVSQVKVRRIMEREQGRSVRTAYEVVDGRSRGIGWKIISGAEQAALAARDRRRGLRWTGRALHTIQTVDRREMSAEDRRRTDEELIRTTQSYAAQRGISARKLGMDDIRAWNQRRKNS